MPDEVLQALGGVPHGAARERGGGVRVGEPFGGEVEQAQQALVGGGELVVAEAQEPVHGEVGGGLRGRRCRVLLARGGLRQGAGHGGAVRLQTGEEVGEGGLGARREPARGEDESGGLPPALLGEPLRRARVGRGASGPRVALDEADGGLPLQAAEGAGADVTEPGERARGDGEEEAGGVVGEEFVDLLRVVRVVEEQQDAAGGERGAQLLGEDVVGGPGRGLFAEVGEEGPRGVPGGTGAPAGSVSRTRSSPSG